MQLERKFVVDFQSVCVNIIRKNKHPQKQENLNNTIFCGTIAQKFGDDTWVYILHSANDGDDICFSLWYMAMAIPNRFLLLISTA